MEVNRKQEKEVQKNLIIEKLKKSGCRVTRQRRILIDIISEGNCTRCKEIYYEAVKRDDSIGMATVYRMVNTLEEIGALNRNSPLCFFDCDGCECHNGCRLEFEDGTILSLSAEKWSEIVSAGLERCGYVSGKNIKCITPAEFHQNVST
jgi:Fur family ferric uptake transcriptional regulator